MSTKYLLQNLRFGVDIPQEEVLAAAKKRASGIGGGILSASVYRRSVDARKRDDISFVYSVLIEAKGRIGEEKLKKHGAALISEPSLVPVRGTERMNGRPVVVGFGPAGMFAALLLAENGLRPIVLERGCDVARRAEKVDLFCRTGLLDPETNVQFGAGGAGTFSDGKLMTRINDARCGYVLRRLAEFGAPAEILTEAKPHIGTDRLRAVVSALCERIRALGGEVLFNTRLDGLVRSGETVTAVRTSAGEIPCGCVVLAIGHSARDTRAALCRDGIRTEPKPFSVGVRIEHLQSDIDAALYGSFAGHPALGHAEYTLSKRIGDEAVYTFCMCPGGEVMAAASEAGGVVTNGMSRHARSGRNANAALVVSVDPADGEGFQRTLERAAFEAGGRTFAAPAQTVGDYLASRAGTLSSPVSPTYKGGDVCPFDLNSLFPARVNALLREGLAAFDRQLPGFSAPFALLTGVETRTSSPVRLPRDPETLLAVGTSNLYPAGEGAGYAGGITSAAVDGIRCAMEIMRRYGEIGQDGNRSEN